MIALEQVEKNYGKKQALKGVNLIIPPGKIIGLVGENGSGKSTLLKIIAGLTTPSSGTIQVNGIKATRSIASKVAYMPDADVFYPIFSVEKLFRFYETQFEDFNYSKACIVAQYLNIPLEAKLKTLSKGNRGRAKMAATLGREASYYLLDEPFSGFDPLVREDIIKGMIQFTDPETQTVLMSTHEIKEAEPLLDAIILLNHGKILAYEEVETIRDQFRMDSITWMTKLIKEGDLSGNETYR
ncbi:ABC transporter ATP-binding protein [Psychrobacillus lasiicapitis]|uniref:ABC transporter ATP-binding protein n=1 Tax=Psychrobacillus lasiicapitis TaxID=1636719 RepID=A0A544TAQ5_9BACI|nr:ABC transporter ATP-binding protein [Psychrobacillus lasiicapitis]TQR14552.1 ABC transporter ATP-binding protein [Psychrobacillus lasiicapitis]GGA30417.1 putative ABC transporter ATP-binding protein YhcG [Psychrobacillus lasiicapitis]